MSNSNRANDEPMKYLIKLFERYEMFDDEIKHNVLRVWRGPSRVPSEESELIRKQARITLIAIALLTLNVGPIEAAGAPMPTTDAEKIADALRGGPTFITKDATLLDLPSAHFQVAANSSWFYPLGNGMKVSVFSHGQKISDN